MRKFVLLLTVLFMLFALSACGLVDKAKDEIASQIEDVVEETVQSLEEDDKDREDEDNEDDDNEDDKKDQGNFSIGDSLLSYNPGLEGQALIDSIEYTIDTMADYNLRYKSEVYYGNELSNVSEMIMFKEDYLMVNEQEDDITSYMLYLNDEGATYSWVDGEPTGTVFYDDPDNDMDDFMEYDSFDLLFEDTEILEARIEDYNGYECVYVHYKEPYGENSEVHLWLSVEFAMQIKMETYENNELLMSYETYDIEWIRTVPADTFNLPRNVEFQEFDFNFDLDDFDLDDFDLDDFDLDDFDLDDFDLEGLDLEGLDLEGLDLESLDIFN